MRLAFFTRAGASGWVKEKEDRIKTPQNEHMCSSFVSMLKMKSLKYRGKVHRDCLQYRYIVLVSGYYLTAEELQTFNVFRENCNKDVTQLTAEGQTQFLSLARLTKVNNLKRKSLLSFPFSAVNT